MNQHAWLAEQFEAERAHLQGVAYRMLGSLSEADDAVQESWLRLTRSSTDEVHNLGGWLTTIVARVCLDMLRARSARREEPLDTHAATAPARRGDGSDPEHEALLAEAVGLALLVVLDTLPPAERLAFVLHDIFAVPFAEIAPIVERSPDAARKLASRARQRVRGTATVPAADLARQHAVVEAFLAASRTGDFAALLAVLDPDVVLRADRTALPTATSQDIHGAAAVAKHFSRRAQSARAALVNGMVGVVVARRGRLFLVLDLTITDGKIGVINVVADPERLRQLHIAVLRA